MARLLLGSLALCLFCIYVNAEDSIICGPNEIRGLCAKSCELNCIDLGDPPCRVYSALCQYECGCDKHFRRFGNVCVLNCPRRGPTKY